MAGHRPLTCSGFVETETYRRSKELVGLSDREIDARLEALIWALHHDAELVATKVRELNLWVAVTDFPPLRVYLRPGADLEGECELLWIEEPD